MLHSVEDCKENVYRKSIAVFIHTVWAGNSVVLQVTQSRTQSDTKAQSFSNLHVCQKTSIRLYTTVTELVYELL